MDNMKELLVFLAKMMSKEQCFDRIHKAIEEYKEASLLNNDVERAEAEIIMSCHLLMLNLVEGKATDVIKQMEEVKRSVDFFKTEKN